MKLVLIGSGNTATVLARKFFASGHNMLQVWSRNSIHARELAEEVQAQVLDSLQEISAEADLVIIAVSDQSLPDVAAQLQLHQRQPVVHTAGAVSREVLNSCSAQYGVFYPLQSLRKEADPVSPIPCLVDASTTHLLQQLKELAESISPQVQVASDEQRLHLHLAAVLVNNFTNHLYEWAFRICQRHQLDFQLLKPLAIETALRLSSKPPGLLQTGPARRNDTDTLEKHRELLADDAQLKSLYENLTDSILAMYDKK
jgi:predicted short-subunit dehydrogenase-like oxidoreductase (DUF2520 family)